jgi:L-arabinokinase
VLASFGGHGLPLPYAEIARRNPLTLLTTDHETADDANAPGNLRRLTRSQLSAHGLRYADLVAAADVVISKPGYGIISECIANGAALLYTPRARFAEQDVLVTGMPRVLRCRAIDNAALISGLWASELRALLDQPAPIDTLSVDGAREAAEHVLALRG